MLELELRIFGAEAAHFLELELEKRELSCAFLELKLHFGAEN